LNIDKLLSTYANLRHQFYENEIETKFQSVSSFIRNPPVRIWTLIPPDNISRDKTPLNIFRYKQANEILKEKRK